MKSTLSVGFADTSLKVGGLADEVLAGSDYIGADAPAINRIFRCSRAHARGRNGRYITVVIVVVVK